MSLAQFIRNAIATGAAMWKRDAAGKVVGLSLPGGGVGGIGGVFTWAGRPSAAACPGATIRISDYGGAAGSLWISDGALWHPLNRRVELYARATDVVGAANTSEQFLDQFVFPVGMPAPGGAILVQYSAGKSGTSDTLSVRVRIGAAGTGSDAGFSLGSITSTTISIGATQKLRILSATSLRRDGCGNAANAEVSTSTFALPAAVTVDNVTSNAIYLSAIAQMTNGTEVPTLRNFTITYISP